MDLQLIANVVSSDATQVALEMTWNILKVAIGLGLVIFVHELGHFLVAKACGVKCEKFYVGFDIPISIGPWKLPSAFVRFQWGETEYGVGILPLGGYVKMLGQDDNPANTEKEAQRIRRPVQSPDETGGDTGGAPGRQEEEYELDPRSYPAKSVPQRMAIISAGVIMNLIFAVIFATFAFNAGVPFTPCEIGDTVPGSPAWRAGLQPGSRIVQIGENGKMSDYLRFDWDLRNAVGLAGETGQVALVLQEPSGLRQVRIRPMINTVDGHRIPMLGIEPARSTKLSSKMPVEKGLAAGRATPALEGSDRITAVNGESVKDGYHLQRLLVANAGKPVTLTVARGGDDDSEDGASETLEVAVPESHLRRLGLIMTAQPIDGIQPGSPAEQAGFQEGDELIAINGEPIEDPLRVPVMLRPFYDQTVDVTVRRKDAGGESHDETIRVTPECPQGFEHTFTFGCPMAVRSLGITFPLVPRVQAVLPDSPADRAGIQPGDEITSVSFKSTDPERKTSKLINRGKPLSLDGSTFTWPFIFDRMQSLEEDEQMVLEFRRADQVLDATLVPVTTDDPYGYRGLVFTPRREIHRAATWNEAISLGFRQTREDIIRVGAFLHKLLTGAVSPTNLGGPISIIAVAGSEASKGVAALLMFLTFLSANLAILNFLPIPALDGGHMVFLFAEAARGKPVDERMQMALTLAGVACLLGLMIFVSVLDIGRFFF